MTYFERILAIAKACDENKIPYVMRECYDGWIIFFPWCNGDVACHTGTYWHNCDMVESYQFPWDEGDVSVLTVEEAIENIVAFFKEKA